jgi:putative inorganic carbon (HCO3(-)) transporter
MLSVMGVATSVAHAFPVVFVSAAAICLLVVTNWFRYPASATSIGHSTNLALGLLLMLALAWWIDSAEKLARAAVVFGFASAGVLLVGLLGMEPPNKFLGFQTDSKAFVMLPLPGLDARGLVNPNALAGASLLAVPVCLAVWLWSLRTSGPHVTTGVSCLVVFLGTMSLVLGQSRAGLAVCGSVVLWLTARQRCGPVRAALISALAVVLVTIGMLALRNGTLSDTERHRLRIWGQAADQLRTAPFLGIGVNRFREVYVPPHGISAYLRDPAHAHNILLQTALDIGVVGLLAYLVLLGAVVRLGADTVRRSTALPGSIAFGGVVSLVAVHLFGLVDAIALGAKVGVLQWLICGLIMASYRQSSRSACATGFGAARSSPT